MLPFQCKQLKRCAEGGAYEYCSDLEGEPVAMRFAGYGVCAFVLEYSCKKIYPTNITELGCAVSYVRSVADEYQIDSERIFICGFSVGGHLAASLAVHWNKPYMTKLFEDNSHKPNGAILCYPVISSGEFAHKGSIENIAGTDQSLINIVSLEKHVDSDTPPVFIWHTADDGTVPVQKTILFTGALAENGIPFESHIFESGIHGLSLADYSTARRDEHLSRSCAKWFGLALDWMMRG